MSTWITICDTCRREGRPEDEAGPRDGARLAELVEAAAGASRMQGEDLRTRRVSCLMGCTHGCNVAVQADGKLSYTLGRFEARTQDAEAIVAYAALHARSDAGQVPYRTWPQGVKGHFITRHPPLPREGEGTDQDGTEGAAG
ncbi:DUF1636 family protein [Profundibacterium mesophilum]|nr:DUF1636 domain-containing protein [Profundibacterium mesophilum]